MKIAHLSLSALSSSGLLNYTKLYLPMIKKSQVRTDNLEFIIGKLEQTLEQYQEMMNMAGSEMLTQQIAMADRYQDYSFLKLRHKVEYEQFEVLEEHHPEADLIMEAIKKAGYSLHTHSYVRQEAALHQLLEGFDKEAKLKAAITALEMDGLVADLKAKFEEFKRLRNLRRTERMGREEDKSMEWVRKELIDQIKRSGNEIDNALFAKPNDEAIQRLVFEISELNDSERSLIKGRETRRAKEQDGSTMPDDQPEKAKPDQDQE